MKNCFWPGWVVIGLGLLLSAGCESDSSGKNAPLPPEQMRVVLRDLHVVNAWVSRQGGPFSRRKDMRNEMYDEVLAKHDLDRATFHAAYQFYLEHPVALDSLYRHIKRELETDLDSLKKDQGLEVKKKSEPKEKPDRKFPLKNRKPAASEEDAS